MFRPSTIIAGRSYLGESQSALSVRVAVRPVFALGMSILTLLHAISHVGLGSRWAVVFDVRVPFEAILGKADVHFAISIAGQVGVIVIIGLNVRLRMLSKRASPARVEALTPVGTFGAVLAGLLAFAQTPSRCMNYYRDGWPILVYFNAI